MNLYLYHNNPSSLISGDAQSETFKLKQEGIKFVELRTYVNDIRTGKKLLPFEIAPKSTERQMEWDDAMAYCATLGDGWRLPTKDETLLIHKIRTHDMEFENSWYWTSTEEDSNYAWDVDFSDGESYFYYKVGKLYVRAVKDKPTK